MKYLIIHREDVKLSTTNLSPKGQICAKRTLETIDGLLKKVPDKCTLIDSSQRDLEIVANYFEPNEKVTLCGAYLGMCLYEANNILRQKKIKVYFHPQRLYLNYKTIKFK